MITLLVAIDKNGLIGNNGKLPWNIPEDMKFFKTITNNQIVVMGRKTYISIGNPLKNRVNVVLSKSIVKNYDEIKSIKDYLSDTIIFNSIEDIKKLNIKDYFVIGGRSIYKEYLENLIPDKILISNISGEFDGNEYFPEIPKEYYFTQSFKISDRVVVKEYRK